MLVIVYHELFILPLTYSVCTKQFYLDQVWNMKANNDVK